MVAFFPRFELRIKQFEELHKMLTRLSCSKAYFPKESVFNISLILNNFLNIGSTLLCFIVGVSLFYLSEFLYFTVAICYKVSIRQ